VGVTVTLSTDELAQVTQLTQIDSDSEAVGQAVGQAVREFLRLTQLRQLQAVSGHVEYDADGRISVSLERHEIGFPR
jgi:Arc/MetJ family transcription regulator